jgi:lysyl-tRNA synthetase class 2
MTLEIDRQRLQERAACLRQLRTFFDDRGFTEVQPPCLMRQCIADTHIEPIKVPGLSVTHRQEAGEFFLQTSPELAMKRMLAAGSGSIYAIVPVFRGGEIGDQHNVEFTMIEWYDVGAEIDAEICLLGELAMQVLGAETYQVRTYRDLFRQTLSFDPMEASLATIRQHVCQIDASLASTIDHSRDAMLEVLMSHLLQPSLGLDDPLILRDYPITQAALARPSVDDPNTAMRFELFYRGIELANGYDELRDADVFVQRTNVVNRQRESLDRMPIPVATTLVEAMRQGLPACSGVAMGLDRVLISRCPDPLTISQTDPMTIDQV